MKHQQETITEATVWLRSLRSIFCRHRVTLLFSPVLSCADKLRGWTCRRTLLRSFRSPMLTQLPRVYRRTGSRKKGPVTKRDDAHQELKPASCTTESDIKILLSISTFETSHSVRRGYLLVDALQTLRAFSKKDVSSLYSPATHSTKASLYWRVANLPLWEKFGLSSTPFTLRTAWISYELTVLGLIIAFSRS